MSDFGFPDPPMKTDELEIELGKFNVVDEGTKLLRLNSVHPNTEEMEFLYDRCTNAIDKAETLLVFLQGYCFSTSSSFDRSSFTTGEAGTGKSTFAQKLLAYCRFKGKIALGCAATALAAQVYKEDTFSTAHYLFDIPVVEDNDDADTLVEVYFLRMFLADFYLLRE